MRTFITSIAIIAAIAASTAEAKTFTFEAKGNPPTTTGTMGPEGIPIAGSYWTGSTTTTWADGKTSNETYTCVSTTQPRRDSIFDMHAICDASGSAGTYSSVWGCNFMDKERTMIGCVGGLYGKTGSYAGKGGGITYSGKLGVGTGAGQWSD